MCSLGFQRKHFSKIPSFDHGPHRISFLPPVILCSHLLSWVNRSQRWVGGNTYQLKLSRTSPNSVISGTLFQLRLWQGTALSLTSYRIPIQSGVQHFIVKSLYVNQTRLPTPANITNTSRRTIPKHTTPPRRYRRRHPIRIKQIIQRPIQFLQRHRRRDIEIISTRQSFTLCDMGGLSGFIFARYMGKWTEEKSVG